MAVTLDLVAQRPDHLRMAHIAAFPHIDVASGQFEGCVGTHPLHLLDRAPEIEKRCYLYNATDGDHQKNTDHQQDRILFERLVSCEYRHDVFTPRAAAPRAERR